MEIIQNSRDSDRKKFFSIITPCYNSSDSIKSVFNSLENLNNFDFEWIVIDDASTDDTLNILKGFLDKVNFPITIFSLKENNMATYCYHLGIEKAEGYFSIFLDHDDLIKPSALDRFLHYWESLSIQQKDKLAGMISLCEDEDGNIVGTKFPRSPDINNYFNLMFDEGVRGEKFFCYKTSIMKNYNFQLVDRYVPESNVMWKISSNYETLFFNESLRVYYQPQKDGSNLSNLNSFEYSLGFRLNYLDLLNNFKSQLTARPYLLISFLFNYSIYSYSSRVGMKSCLLDLKSFLHKVIFIPIYILTQLLFVMKIFPNK